MKLLRSLVAPVTVSLLNQGVSAASNFLFAVYLVRALGAESYGLYAAAFSIALLVAGLGNAVILLQMVVQIFGRPIDDRKAYAASMLWLTVGVSAASSVLVPALALPFRSMLPSEFASSGVLLSAVAAAVALLCKEFFVRHAYIEKRESRALRINAWSALTLACAVGLFEVTDVRLGASAFVLVYAFAQGCGALVGFRQARLPLSEVSVSDIKACAIEAWRGGRWAILMSAAFWLQTNFYIYVATGVLGVAAVGYVAASRLLIAPITVLLPAVQQVLLPRLAEIRNHWSHMLVPTALQISSVLLVLSIVYSSLVIAWVDVLQSLVLGPQFAGDPEVRGLVLTWALYATVHVLRTGAAGVLQVRMEFGRISAVYIAGWLVGVAMALILVERHGLVGIMWGMIVSEAFTAGMMWALVMLCARNSAACRPAGLRNG